MILEYGRGIPDRLLIELMEGYFVAIWFLLRTARHEGVAGTFGATTTLRYLSAYLPGHLGIYLGS